MPNIYGKAQSKFRANFDPSGIIYQETAAFGTAFATTATVNASLAKALLTGIPMAILRSSTDSTSRLYCHDGTAWKYTALT